jgi:hypothetical protein
MSTILENIKIINSNTIIGDISVSPNVPNEKFFSPKTGETNCCITICDSYNDHNSVQKECVLTKVNDRNYFFYGTNGTCISKLKKDRKNSNFGTIRPKNIKWKFLNDVKIKRIEGYKSFLLFNKYPGLYELSDDDNKMKLMMDDFENVRESNSDLDDIICFVSKNIIDLVTKYKLEFPFKDYIVIESISHMIEYLFGKVVSSGEPFHGGFIKCTTNGGESNNVLHAQYNDKNIDFQALRYGLVEFSTTKINSCGEFIIFCEFPVTQLFLDDVKIDIFEESKCDNVANITSLLIDSEKIKCGGENFVGALKNAVKIQYYKFNSVDKIVGIDVNINSMLRTIGNLVVRNIRQNLKSYEDDQKNMHYGLPPTIGKQVSDGGYIGQFVSCPYENYENC